MSKLEELLEDYCPDGVEYKPLKEIAQYGKERVDSSEINSETYVGVDNLLPNKTGKVDSSYVPSEGRLIKFYKDDILIGNIRPYLKKIWLSTCDGGTNGDVLDIHIKNLEQISSKYLFYVLSSDDFFFYDMQYAKGAKMPRGNKDAVMQYEIPVPPLPVQQEIVRILDMFTGLTAELTDKLTAELTARKKQYEYYRDKIFNNVENNAPSKKLGDLITFLNGRAYKQEELLSNGKYKVVRVGNFFSNNSWYYYSNLELESEKYCNKGDLLYTWAASLGAFIWNDEKAIYHYHVWKLDFDETKIDKEYLLHFFNYDVNNIQKSLTESTMPHISMANMKKRTIPVPAMEKQKEIAKKMNQLSDLCTSISTGLPAEIEAREKQYEYYRDKLLTFKRKA